jgi:hypothetical protein
VDNIRMDLGEVGWGDVDWIGLAWDVDQWRALVNTVMKLRAPIKYRDFPQDLYKWALLQKGSAPWS